MSMLLAMYIVEENWLILVEHVYCLYLSIVSDNAAWSWATRAFQLNQIIGSSEDNPIWNVFFRSVHNTYKTWS